VSGQTASCSESKQSMLSISPTGLANKSHSLPNIRHTRCYMHGHFGTCLSCRCVWDGPTDTSETNSSRKVPDVSAMMSFLRSCPNSDDVNPNTFSWHSQSISSVIFYTPDIHIHLLRASACHREYILLHIQSLSQKLHFKISPRQNPVPLDSAWGKLFIISNFIHICPPDYKCL